MTWIPSLKNAGAAVAALAVVFTCTGCGQRNAGPPPQARAQSALAKKLSAMKPEERAAYIREHPEVLSTLGGQSPTDNP
jgi:hypothetical protein